MQHIGVAVGLLRKLAFRWARSGQKTRVGRWKSEENATDRRQNQNTHRELAFSWSNYNRAFANRTVYPHLMMQVNQRGDQSSPDTEAIFFWERLYMRIICHCIWPCQCVDCVLSTLQMFESFHVKQGNKAAKPQSVTECERILESKTY